MHLPVADCSLLRTPSKSPLSKRYRSSLNNVSFGNDVSTSQAKYQNDQAFPQNSIQRSHHTGTEYPHSMFSPNYSHFHYTNTVGNQNLAQYTNSSATTTHMYPPIPPPNPANFQMSPLFGYPHFMPNTKFTLPMPTIEEMNQKKTTVPTDIVDKGSPSLPDMTTVTNKIFRPFQQ